MDKNLALVIGATALAAVMPFILEGVKDVMEDADIALEKKTALKQLFDQALIPVLETAVNELKKDRGTAALEA